MMTERSGNSFNVQGTVKAFAEKWSSAEFTSVEIQSLSTSTASVVRVVGFLTVCLSLGSRSLLSPYLGK